MPKDQTGVYIMNRMRVFLGILASAFAGVDTYAQTTGKVCNVAFQVCPKNLEGTTIQVPEDAIWLEPKLPFCNEQVQVQTGTGTPPPAIVFIIDNSGSMNSADPNKERFRVPSSLLDSIYKAEPTTQVGLVVFNRRLMFDHRENPYFQDAFPPDTSQHDSYVPLTALNKVFPNGKNGLDSLKELLRYDNSGALIHQTRLPSSRGSTDPNWSRTNTRDGTDITLGFLGGKEAVKNTSVAKQNQYFIFLSDGLPVGADSGRVAMIWDWMRGENTPTTYTVFFRDDSSPSKRAEADRAVDSVTKMTNAIKANGYSPSNPKSGVWAINAQLNQLLGLLSSNVINPIFANKAATPASAKVQYGAGQSLDNSSMDGGSFIFPSRVPLSPNQTNLTLTYNYTYVDSGITKNHTATYTVNIQRVPNGALPAGVTTLCKDAGDIELYNKGQKVGIVTADHDKLDVKLILPNGEVCTNCTVIVQPHANRAGKDNEGVSVIPSGGTTYTGSFGRETDNVPKARDGILQHLPGDSIVVTWTNPQNPLDVIRRAFPYRDVRTALDVINHNTWSRGDAVTPVEQRKQWILVGSNTVKITPEDGNSDCCKLVTTLPPEDSIKYVGIKVTASRSFKVDIKVYDNLGQYVNKIAFSVSQAEFDNLPREGAGVAVNRSMRVLWDNRTEDGAFAGTGAYIFKTTVTLNRVPGIAEDQVVRTDHRLVGVVRPQ